MKTRNIFISLILGAMALVGCSGHLDIAKHGNMGGQEDFYKTDDQALEAVTAIYSSLLGNYYNNWFALNLLSDDAWAGGGSRGDNGDYERLNEFNFGTDHGSVQGLFSGAYAQIYKANLVIEKVEPDTPIKAQMVAEAKVFRAISHFDLVTLFGTAPKVDHLLQPDEYRLPNSTSAELWEQVEKDLTEAISSGSLTSKSGVNDAAGSIRVTREYAKAILGKAYVFQGKWAEARKVLDEIIDSKLYDLDKGNLEDLHHMPCAFSPEALFEIQRRNDVDHPQFTFFDIMLGWRADKMSVDATKQHPDHSTSGWGFLNPRKGLYDAFVAEEGVDGYRLNATIHTYEQLNAEGLRVQAGVTLVGNEGYFDWKFRLLKSDATDGWDTFPAFQAHNLKIMRYAEVLLLAAEAHLNGGDASKAAAYVNQVRDRAHLAPKGSVSMADVKLEKRLELALEGVRFLDLVRWGDAESVLKDQGKKIYGLSDSGVAELTNLANAEAGFKAKHKLLPIPQKEIELNSNISQNEGWK